MSSATATTLALLSGLGEPDIKRVIRAISDELIRGNSVRLDGFATIKPYKVGAYEVKTPAVKGGVARMPESRRIKLTLCGEFKRQLNPRNDGHGWQED